MLRDLKQIKKNCGTSMLFIFKTLGKVGEGKGGDKGGE